MIFFKLYIKKYNWLEQMLKYNDYYNSFQRRYKDIISHFFEYKKI